MHTRRALIISLLFTLVLLLTVLQDHQRGEPQTLLARDAPDMYMADAEIIQFNTAGRVARKIHAARVSHYPLDDRTEISEPRVTLYNQDALPDQQATWQIAARLGKLLPGQAENPDTLELYERVVAKRQKAGGSGLQISGHAMKIIPELNRLETDQPVVIQDSGSRTLAAGLKAYLNDERLLLYSSGEQRVHTTLMPSHDRQDRQTALER